jgi:hypothetical protein
VSAYATDFAKEALPPGLLLDAASTEVVKMAVLRERDQSIQGDEWLIARNAPGIGRVQKAWRRP